MRKLRACALSTTIYTSIIVIKHSQRRKAIRAVIILRLKGEGIEIDTFGIHQQDTFSYVSIFCLLGCQIRWSRPVLAWPFKRCLPITAFAWALKGCRRLKSGFLLLEKGMTFVIKPAHLERDAPSTLLFAFSYLKTSGVAMQAKDRL
jgi:hypothetical protein